MVSTGDSPQPDVSPTTFSVPGFSVVIRVIGQLPEDVPRLLGHFDELVEGADEVKVAPLAEVAVVGEDDDLALVLGVFAVPEGRQHFLKSASRENSSIILDPRVCEIFCTVDKWVNSTNQPTTDILRLNLVC